MTQLTPGQIVDIRWDRRRDVTWLRGELTRDEFRDVARFPSWFRRSMSVYRCACCGQVGALEGIGEDTLLVFTLKQRRCPACTGCECQQCQTDRAHAA